MSNFFRNHSITEAQIMELMSQIHLLQIQDKVERQSYMEELRKLIIHKPNLTAASLAAFLSDDEDERASIKASIASLGSASYNSRLKYPYVKNPSMPELKRKRKTFTRRFIELADDNSVIGEFKVKETKNVYYIGD